MRWLVMVAGWDDPSFEVKHESAHEHTPAEEALCTEQLDMYQPGS
jgi:hypothetical protein